MADAAVQKFTSFSEFFPFYLGEQRKADGGADEMQHTARWVAVLTQIKREELGKTGEFLNGEISHESFPPFIAENER